MPAAVPEAVAEERRLLSRRLHDTVCQSFHGVNMLALVLLRRLRKEGKEVPPELEELAALLSQSLDELQAVTHALEPEGAKAVNSPALAIPVSRRRSASSL